MDGLPRSRRSDRSTNTPPMLAVRLEDCVSLPSKQKYHRYYEMKEMQATSESRPPGVVTSRFVGFWRYATEGHETFSVPETMVNEMTIMMVKTLFRDIHSIALCLILATGTYTCKEE